MATQVTKNFTREEFECHCGCNCNETKDDLIIALQQLRDIIGKPITVTSGYRCPTHNAEVGGAPASQHLLGIAADIHVAHYPINRLFAAAEQVPAFKNGGIGVADTFLHLDIRQTVARWSYDENGHTVAFVPPPAPVIMA